MLPMIKYQKLLGAIAATLLLAACQNYTVLLEEAKRICAISGNNEAKYKTKSLGLETSKNPISFPSDFIAEDISGESCTKYYYPSRIDEDLQFIEELRFQNDRNLRQGTSLTVKHDYLSRRWAKLLGITYGVASANNEQDARKIVKSLVLLAEEDTLLDSLKPYETIGQPCWKGGDKNAPCAFHTSQHAGFTFIAMLYSAVILEEYISPEERIVLDRYFEKTYGLFIKPMAYKGKGPNKGFYEFADYGLGVLAYANYTNNHELAYREIIYRKAQLDWLITQDGYIDNNSYRGVRSYWYHTLGVESALGYALVAREHGVDFFKDPVLGHKLCLLAEKTVEGAADYDKFMSKGYRGFNYSTDTKDKREHMHQLAVGLPLMIRKEFGITVPVSARYKKLSREETIDRLIGFNSDCYYSSQ